MANEKSATKPKTSLINASDEDSARSGNRRRKQGSAPQADSSRSKSATVLRLLQRKRGATIGELQNATGWQAHSVRGFLSGTVKKRMSLHVTSEKGADGVRRYLIAKG